MHFIDVPAEILPDPTVQTDSAKWREKVAASSYASVCKSILFDLISHLEEESLSQAEAAKMIKHGTAKKALSGTSLSQLLNGSYPADPLALCKSIERYLNQSRARALFAVSGFVETPVYSVLSDLADTAVITQRITCLHGGLLRGKTTNAHVLASRYDRASVIYTTMPYADTYGGFVRRLANARNLPLKGSLSEIREAIIRSLDSSHLLIIDEFHMAIVTYAPGQARRVYEFIREINDLAKCGVLLIGSSAGYAALATAPEYERLAAVITAYDLGSDAIDSEDLAPVLKSFNLEPSPDRIATLQRVASEHTLGKVFDLLRLATARAAKRRQTFAWNHVLDTVAPTLKLAAA